jgi:putative ABC transport system permease protein
MSNLSLLATFSLVMLGLVVSRREQLGLERDLVIGSIRATVQLFAVGLVLKYVFAASNFFFTGAIVLVMIYNAAIVAAKRGQGIVKGFRIAFIAITSAEAVVLSVLIACQAISFRPSEAIPISGMIIGNSMVAIGLVFRELKTRFTAQTDELETKLSLGASPKQASLPLIRGSIRTAFLPTVDSMKTLGIVQLPGMMTGLILAGTSPEAAIKYQLMVAFMLVGAVTIATMFASFLAYKNFYNQLAQLQSQH